MLRVGLVFALLGGCSSGSLEHLETIEEYSSKAIGDYPTEKKRARLLKLSKENPRWRNLSGDALTIFDAQIHEKKGKLDLALKAWLEALRGAGPGLDKLAFDGWLKISHRLLGGGQTSDSYVTYVYKEVVKLQDLDVVIAHKLTNRPRVEAFLKQKFDQPAQPIGSISFRSSNDLVERFSKGCFTDPSRVVNQGEQNHQFNSLRLAFVAKCRGDFSRALILLQREIKILLDRKQYTLFLEQLLAEALKMARSAGDREAIAWVYTRTAYLMGGFSRRSNIPSVLKFIDSSLWAARYSALLGRYRDARYWINKSLKHISDVTLNVRNLSKRDRRDLLNFKAEASHIQAFRILVEERKYGEARSLAQTTLEIPGLSETWRARLTWYSGLYAFLDGKFAEARQSWEEALKEGVTGMKRARTLFWVARAGHKIGDTQSRDLYLETLYQEFPDDYYSLVAPRLAGFPHHEMDDVFVGNSRPKLLDSNVEILKSNPGLATARLRVELFLAAGAKELAGEVADYLRRELSTISPRRAPYDFYYLAKLLTLTGRANEGIRVLDKVRPFLDEEEVSARERAAINYPLPYTPLFERVSRDSGVPLAVMYGITRQESLFNPRAKSPMDAFGFMQIILSTARRFGGASLVAEELLRPETNVSIGARYLGFLKSYFGDRYYHVYSAYNAGEYAVDIWQRRRFNRDLLLMLELIPFSETRRYTQNVWRNRVVYEKVLENS